MKVRYRALALADLDHIFGYLNDRNPIAAEDVTKAIYAAIELIGEHPLGAPPTSDPAIHVKVVRKYGYKIFYTVETDAVEILHVRDGVRRPWTVERRR
jgi:plasmid stabilization system protein ParE